MTLKTNKYPCRYLVGLQSRCHPSSRERDQRLSMKAGIYRRGVNKINRRHKCRYLLYAMYATDTLRRRGWLSIPASYIDGTNDGPAKVGPHIAGGWGNSSA